MNIMADGAEISAVLAEYRRPVVLFTRSGTFPGPAVEKIGLPDVDLVILVDNSTTVVLESDLLAANPNAIRVEQIA